MIEVHDYHIGEIPILELVQSDLKMEKLPTVIYYHGWTNQKERILSHGYEIARQGMRVVIPEALYHGGRNDGQPIEKHFKDFWEIVITNVLELPKIIKYLVENNKTDQKRVGVAGLSMGGMTTCAILATYPEIKAANVLMGAPDINGFMEGLLGKIKEVGYEVPDDIDEQLTKIKQYNLGLQPEKMGGRPVHFWHGTEDDTVPYANAYEFYEKNRDTEAGHRLTFTTTKHGHRVPHVISLETASFFKEVL